MTNVRRDAARALRDEGELERRRPGGGAARERYEEAVAALRELDEPLVLAHTIRHLGDVHHDAGRTVPAAACYREALDLYRGHDGADPLDLANAVRSMAVLKDEAGELEPARQLWEEARVLYVAGQVAPGVEECASRMAALAFRAADDSETEGGRNKALVRSWIAFSNARFRGRFEPFIADDYVGHMGGADVNRLELERLERTFVAAFPDLHHGIDDLLAERDRVVLRATGRGTHRSAFEGVPATGRRVEFTAMVLYRIENRRIAESWGEVDFLRLMRQLRGAPA
jgi:steroid delta-isomerase-like uncharacterized protein